MQKEITTHSKWRIILLIIIAWLAMVGLDFFLHAGLLARLYLQPGPFLLSPLTALTLIPVGYLSLFLLAMLIIWLMIRLELAGWREGLLFGLKLGGLIGGAFMLGLLSVSTAAIPLLLGWFIGQMLEFALAGAIIGSGLAGIRLRRLFGIVMGFVLLSVIATIILQTLGVVPTTHILS